jgi:undecaprenyl diphosphate synthase
MFLNRACPSLQVDKGPPGHIAIIMDGNGRWAKNRGWPRSLGHQHGAHALRRTLKAADALGVRYVTVYGFSSENWQRPKVEIDSLMDLVEYFIEKDLMALHESGTRIRLIGDRTTLPSKVNALFRRAEILTENNSGLTFIVAFNYGARQELLQAVKKLIGRVQTGELSEALLSEDHIVESLETWDIPDPDLLIRTSGEQRLSNFLLWQLAYTELVFMPILWPDFGEEALQEAIEEFWKRHRRFGALAS